MAEIDKAELDRIYKEIFSLYPNATQIHIDIYPGGIRLIANYPKKKQEENNNE